MSPVRKIDTNKIFLKYGYDPMQSIYIPGEVYSSKNHKRVMTRPYFLSKGSFIKKQNTWRLNGKRIIPFIGDTEAVMFYKDQIIPVYIANRKKFLNIIDGLNFPLFIEICFIVPTKRKWDFNNLTQLVTDMMVMAEWVEDDSVRELFPVPPRQFEPPYFINKEDSGVIITPIKTY